VIWYWEFDTEKRYFHEFRTVDYTKAMRIYEKSKFEMWDEPWNVLSSNGHVTSESEDSES
jgi:hypothetical protein